MYLSPESPSGSRVQNHPTSNAHMLPSRYTGTYCMPHAENACWLVVVSALVCRPWAVCKHIHNTHASSTDEYYIEYTVTAAQVARYYTHAVLCACIRGQAGTACKTSTSTHVFLASSPLLSRRKSWSKKAVLSRANSLQQTRSDNNGPYWHCFANKPD